ncbi:MAG TPA: glycosyl hydrolase [Verrucomicrobiales bacterium]|nr:glycosyl hydrolase [Verrucomicrobiales bacterium]
MPSRSACRRFLSLLFLCPALAGLAAEDGAFRKLVLESQCDNPMELTVLPDGRVLFIERFGKVRLWKPDTGTTVTAAEFAVHGRLNAIIAKKNDEGSWEAGLLGVTQDPGFATNGWIYLYWSPKDAQGNRLSRFTLTGDNLDRASEKRILEVAVQREVCCHEAGSLAFDGAGNLFISTGDNTNPFESDGYSPTDYRDDRHPWDAARSAGNANDLRGKILRIRPTADGGYEVPAGNLFPPGTPDTRPEIFAMGNRNPFRISVDRRTGTLYWGDVGPDAREISADRGPAGFDEINRTQTAGNFGWPFVIANNKSYRMFDFQQRQPGEAQAADAPRNDSPRNTGPRVLPPARPAWIWYPYTPSAQFRELGSGGRSAAAGPVYHFDPALDSPRKLPARWDNCLFLYDWERHWIVAARLDERGELKSLERFAPEITLKRPVELELGPDGALYGIEFGTGWENNKDSQLVRIEWAAH